MIKPKKAIFTNSDWQSSIALVGPAGGLKIIDARLKLAEHDKSSKISRYIEVPR